MNIERHTHKRAFSKQAWRGRQRSCGAGGGQWVVSGAAVLLLHVLRVLGLAPVSITPTRAGYLVTLSTPLTLYVYIKHIIISIIIISGFIYDLQLKHTSRNFNQFVPSIVLWIIYVFISLSATGIGALCSPKRIIRLMNYWREADMITRQHNITHGTRQQFHLAMQQNDKSIRLQLTLLGIVEFITLASNILSSLSSDIYSAIYFVINYYANNVNTNVLMIQIMFVVQRVQETLHSVNKRLRGLLEELQFHRNIGRSFRASETIDEISQQLWAASELATRLNGSEGAALLYLFAVFVFKMNLCVYNAYMNWHDVYKSTSTVLEITMEILKIFWSIRHIIYLMFLIEPCHGIHQELLRSPVSVSKLLCGARSPAVPLARALRRLALPMHSDTHSRVFVPLGAIAFSRSLYTTVFGTITTCLALFVKVT